MIFEDLALFVMGLFWAVLTLLLGYGGFVLIHQGHLGMGAISFLVALVTSTLIRG